MTLYLPGIEPTSGAEFSPCKKWRYRLWRVWNPKRSTLAVCMLNPSTANHEANDPTIRRCIGFAKSWGYGGLEVVNMFAWRATNPKELLTVEDPMGPFNDMAIDGLAKRHGNILIAWGTAKWGAHKARAMETLALIRSNGTRVWCLGKTKHGYPRHPLYVRASQEMEPYG
jgi:hypothetical protein